jgi:endoribonuclease Dicer
MGAIFLDSGFNLGLVWKIALSFLDPIKRFSSLQVSPIRELRELCQAYNLNLQFLPSNMEGMFLVEAQVNGKDVSTTASAVNLNKNEARGIASQKILTKLKVCFLYASLSCCLNSIKFYTVRNVYSLYQIRE